MAEPEQDSIFELGDLFDYQSPFPSDWVKEQQEARQRRQQAQEREVRVLAVDGPFDDLGRKVAAVSRHSSYIYRAYLNAPLTPENIAKVEWSVSYDEAPDTSTVLFAGGRMDKSGGIAARIQVSEGRNGFRIQAEIPASTNGLYNSTDIVNFKKVTNIFIGGAGDVKSYFGIGPTDIMLRVQEIFDEFISSLDYRSILLGFDDVYEILKGRTKIKEVIISQAEITQVNVIGHSLGGWNGAHLSQHLSNAGYDVGLLVTLDPVGTKVGVTLLSEIPWDTPRVRCEQWINIYSDPESFDSDDAIAWMGGQWRPKPNGPQPQREIVFDGHHREALKMLKFDLGTGHSASDLLFFRLHSFWDSK